VTRSVFPFAALVGLDTLKLALELSAIDARLSVLIRGDKGSGKSTAARALAELLPKGAPFVNLPIGATEDRLLGGLDVERALKGEPTLKPGLAASAHGGVLYIDEVNLLADHLADALLDTAASGVLVVEREGFSVSQPAAFVLLGSMNPEEGALRPQLLDRFALVVDVAVPMDPQWRAHVLERRLAYDADPVTFSEAWQHEQIAISGRLARERARAPQISVSQEMLEFIAGRVAEHGVHSLRADLAVVRASRAHAALIGADVVTEADVEAVLPLALTHRLPHGTRPPANPPLPPTPPCNDGDASAGEENNSGERVFQLVNRPTPRLVVEQPAERPGAGEGRNGPRVGPVVAVRRTDKPAELDVRASVVHAFARSGSMSLDTTDLHERVRAPHLSTRFILVVDSSGSHAVLDRMRLVKGVAAGLLDASYGRHDEVVVIACRGAHADVLVEPTSSRDAAERALEYLPTGGRTPLAHGLELAASYVTDNALVIVITDGRANVPTRTDDAWHDAQQAARAIPCAALVLDTEDSRTATGRPGELAEALRATYAKLDDLDPSHVLTIVRGSR
jgi:magnesium chelatase subunit D